MLRPFFDRTFQYGTLYIWSREILEWLVGVPYNCMELCCFVRQQSTIVSLYFIFVTYRELTNFVKK